MPGVNWYKFTYTHCVSPRFCVGPASTTPPDESALDGMVVQTNWAGHVEGAAVIAWGVSQRIPGSATSLSRRARFFVD